MKKIVLGEEPKEKIIENGIKKDPINGIAIEPKHELVPMGDKIMENKRIRASFSKLKGDMLSLTTDTNEIKLKYISNSKENISPEIDEFKKIVTYKNVEQGIDLQYELEEKRLKESFVINERNNNYTFNFETRIGKLEPFYNEERKCLELKKDNKVICRMLPPYMFDNRGEESKKCSYEIESNQDGLLQIKLIADADWINSDDRELPITIDPTFEIESNFVYQYNFQKGGISLNTVSNPDEVFVGYKNQDNDFKYYSFEIYMNVDVSSSNCKYYFEMPVNYNIMDNAEDIVVLIDNVAIGTYKPNQLVENGIFRIDITEHVKSLSSFYIKFCVASDGSLGRASNPSYVSRSTYNQGVYKASFKAFDTTGQTCAKIVIEPKEESRSFIDYDLGVSGTTSVNIQTKRYRHTVNDLSIKSGLLSLNINHIFDSNNTTSGTFGDKWTLSVLNNRLVKENLGIGRRKVSYFDGDGFEHIFVEKWFYKNGKNKVYIEPTSITFNENNELIYKNGSIDYKAEYELVNEEGFSYVSLGSLTDYDAKNVTYQYYIKYSNFSLPMISGKTNYYQFVCYVDGKKYYVTNTSVQLKNNEYIANVNGKFRRVFLTTTYTATGSTAQVTMYSGYESSKTPKTVKLEKIPVYENLDKGLYTSYDIENLEYQKNQSLINLKQINEIIDRDKSNESSILSKLVNIELEDEKKDEYSSNLTLYNQFIQLENEINSAYQQKTSIEINSYFLTRNFNAKIKEQKESANDYIIDQEGNIILFDGYGRMIGLANNHENKIEVSYDEDSNVQSIKTDEENIIFKYNDNSKLEMMKKSNGDTVKFSYLDNLLTEINNNGRKTTFTYINGFVVYSDNNDELIIDTQADNTYKVKKYVEPGTISQSTTFNFFANRTLVQNDMFEYFYGYHTFITDRILDRKTYIYFDIGCGKINCQSDPDNLMYATYDRGHLISKVNLNVKYDVLYYPEDFKITDNKFCIENGSITQDLTRKIQAYCLRTYLNSGVEFEGKNVTLKVSYYKSGQTFNFEQTFIGKDDCCVVLPFFVKGNVTKLNISVTANTNSKEELSEYIDCVDVIEVNNGVLNEYDEKNRLWKIKTNEGKTTYLEFENDLPTKIEFKDWDGTTVTTECSYDNEGRIISSVDSKGNCKDYLYEDGGNRVETKEYNLKDASLVRSNLSVFDEKTKTFIQKGSIKNEDGVFTEQKCMLYPGTNVVKTEIGLDGTKTIYNYNQKTKKIVGLIKENDGIKNSVSYMYNLDFLTTIKNNGTEVNYTYDGRKRIKTVKVKDCSYTALSNKYTDNTDVEGKNDSKNLHGYTVEATQNGIYVRTSSYNKYGNLIKLEQCDSKKENKYTTFVSYANDNIQSIETEKNGNNNYIENINYEYYSDNLIKQCSKTFEENGALINKWISKFGYNNNSQLSSFELEIDGMIIQESSYTYDSEKRLTKETISSSHSISYEYDVLNRVNHKDIKIGANGNLCHSYSYLQQDGHTLDLIAEDNVKVATTNNSYSVENHKYKYDVNGRVTEINIDDKKISYEYDGSGRLVKEHNEILGKENKYSYDTLGNIVSKRTYDLANGSLNNEDELIYSCDSKRLLVSVNGNPVTHDTYGRMISYKDKTFSWNKDGTLQSVLSSSNLSAEYAYNHKGIRYLKKLDSGESIRYFLDDSNKILKEQHDTFSISYLYAINNLFGFSYNNEVYIYERNIFGDIVRIYNQDAEVVGEYNYDAFGNVTIVTDVNGIASLNPFRYRGYYYDNETGLYYLNYRYYDPSIGRFISPDDISYINQENVNGLNIYAYCNNDPVNLCDPSGHLPKWVNWLIGGILVVGSIALTVATAGLGGAIAGAIGTGVWASIAGGAIAGGIVGAASGALISAGTQIISNGVDSISWSEVGKGALTGFITGAIAGGIFGGITHAYSAKTLATASSGLDAAKYELNNSFGTLRSVKSLSKMPFASSNIAKAVANAAINYNNAYANYIVAKLTYEILNYGFSIAYFVGESYLSDWLGTCM